MSAGWVSGTGGKHGTINVQAMTLISCNTIPASRFQFSRFEQRKIFAHKCEIITFEGYLPSELKEALDLSREIFGSHDFDEAVRDGLVCTVKLQTSTGQFERPVTELVKLPVEAGDC